MGKAKVGKVSILLVEGALVVAVLFIILASLGRSSDTSSSLPSDTSANMMLAAPTFATPTVDLSRIKVHERNHILDGASPEQVGQYAQQYAQQRFDGRSPSQLLLSRPVTYEEIPELGFGCMGNASYIENPPWVLVILKGDFSLSSLPGSAVLGDVRTPYVVMVFDVWAAEPTLITGSMTGGLVKKALNDPNLPDEVHDIPTDCPTRLPGILPYGVEIPGVTLPTVTAALTSSPKPTEIVPPAIQTRMSGTLASPPPLPVSTSGPK